MAQHEVTGPAGRTPRQGQRFDWWSVPASAGVQRRPAKGRSARAVVPAPRQLRPVPPVEPPPDPAAAQVYREVQQSEAFQEIRRSYRTFVFPATAVFLGWYLLYVTAQAAAPS